MRRGVLAVMLVCSMVLAGCYGDGESIVEDEEYQSAWENYVLIDEQTHESPRNS